MSLHLSLRASSKVSHKTLFFFEELLGRGFASFSHLILLLVHGGKCVTFIMGLDVNVLAFIALNARIGRAVNVRASYLAHICHRSTTMIDA